ncbi:hypothetical protein GCM10007160_15490 [Litchfieldella qijiaojingensis]|uniref:DNA-binding protein n=1 Tax=Litchfieldella qijiaojingensis TaxID=980347 RepID=A0ABQ2YQ76_9GAMM|nr:hypothetical protein [Halomonas qijiaojingensis]GGX89051.1 hypothetical protein GCM10007160_15490 [Halomonas qijiaojingensis]
MDASELILYQTDDGRTAIHLRAEGGTVWLTQAEIAELFATSPQAITQHIRTIYADRELAPEATCKEFLQVRQEGSRQVRRRLKSYSLPMPEFDWMPEFGRMPWIDLAGDETVLVLP